MTSFENFRKHKFSRMTAFPDNEIKKKKRICNRAILSFAFVIHLIKLESTTVTSITSSS